MPISSALTRIEPESLDYAIRSIPVMAAQIAQLAQHPLQLENIGDPVQNGIRPPAWMREIIARTVQEGQSYAYTPSAGHPEARRYLASLAPKAAPLEPENILFYNGVGDAISALHQSLNPNIRLVLPAPCYPAWSVMEAQRTGLKNLYWHPSANNDWQPDFHRLKSTLRDHPDAGGLVLIQPSNPLGLTLNQTSMRRMVQLAREFDLLLISDEIYRNFQDPSVGKNVLLEDVCQGIRAISLKGISKDIPWPGGRCGWAEFRGTQQFSDLNRLQEVMLKRKMLEVGSTSLPQTVLPEIMSHPCYSEWLQDWNQTLQSRREQAHAAFHAIPGVECIPATAGFYYSLRLKGRIDPVRTLPPSDARTLLSSRESILAPDHRLCEQVVALSGICTIPLSGFGGGWQGFRMTLLARQPVFTERLEKIAKILLERIEYPTVTGLDVPQLIG